MTGNDNAVRSIDKALRGAWTIIRLHGLREE
jgi:hypothetical protein